MNQTGGLERQMEIIYIIQFVSLCFLLSFFFFFEKSLIWGEKEKEKQNGLGHFGKEKKKGGLFPAEENGMYLIKKYISIPGRQIW